MMASSTTTTSTAPSTENNQHALDFSNVSDSSTASLPRIKIVNKTSSSDEDRSSSQPENEGEIIREGSMSIIPLTRRKRGKHRRKSCDPLPMKKMLLDPYAGDDDSHGADSDEDFYGSRFDKSNAEQMIVDEPPTSIDIKEYLRMLVSDSEMMGCEQSVCVTKSESDYNLKWRNHEADVLSSFELLLANETFCDVTIICDDEEEGEAYEYKPVEFKAHKIVLSACSPFFKVLLEGNVCKQAMLVLKDFVTWEMEAVMDFMYRGEVDVLPARVEGLLKTAKSLQVIRFFSCW